jgi:cystathionine beta-lyase/cystathionine gamma-synthase
MPEHSETQTGLSTRAVHAGSPDSREGEAVVNPIVQSATFFSRADGGGDVRYTRYGNNPTHDALARRICALEGAESAISTGSGNAAMALALLACAGSGGRILAQRELYGGTIRLLTRELPRLGIAVDWVPYDGDWSAHLTPATRVMLTEIPVNPTLRVPDVPVLAELARSRGLPLVVDATFATPYNFRPLEHGASLVVHSATKYLGGHSDLSAGIVAGRLEWMAEVREKLISFGPILDPHAAWLLERGIKTLGPRMARHNENGLAIARWLDGQPTVAAVHYPGLQQHPDHARAARLLAGYGGMVSFVAEGGDEAAERVVSRLRLVRAAPSLGGVESLVSVPRFTSHSALTAEERRAAGIDAGFIRLSLGIEDAADIIADLEQALEPEAARR